MTEALERRSRELTLNWCDITRTGLRIKTQPTLDEWTALGETLATLEGGIAWLVGDWLNTGESVFGELAAQVISHEDWAAETVRVYRWVCAKVPQENRVLSFAHCQAVAGLPAHEQKQWLAKATKGDEGGDEPWSSTRLKTELSSTVAPSRKVEYLCTVSFDQVAPRDIMAAEWERVGRPVFKNERFKREKKEEL